MRITRLLKQKRVSKPWYGALKTTYQQCLPYITLLNFCLISVTAYNTTVRDWFETKGIGIEFWHMALALLAGIGLLFFIEYKFSIPSIFKFNWDQGFTHSTLLPSKLKDIEDKIDRLLKEKDETSQ